MKKKILAAVFAAVISACSLTGAAYASDYATYSYDIAPYYSAVASATLTVTESGLASCYSDISDSGVTKITATQTLQKQGFLWIWSDVKNASWTKTVNTYYLYMNNTKSGLDSGNYRIETVFTLTKSDGSTETITIYSNEVSATVN